jgi:hypothetical protein
MCAHVPTIADLVTSALAVSAIAGRCREPPQRIAPTGLSPQQARHPNGTGGQPAPRHRHTTTGPTPTPRARTRRHSATDSRRRQTRVPPVAGATAAAQLSASGSHPSPPVPPSVFSLTCPPEFNHPRRCYCGNCRSPRDLRRRAAAVDLPLPATGALSDRTRWRPRHCRCGRTLTSWRGDRGLAAAGT